MKCLIKVVFIFFFYWCGYSIEVICLFLIRIGSDIVYYKVYRGLDIE